LIAGNYRRSLLRKKLFIIDGTALAYRSHFAFIKNPLINSKGQHTSALYGVINSFIKLYSDHTPDYLAVVFDRKEPTFRHQIFPDYKANRPVMPDALVSQLDDIHSFFHLASVSETSLPGYEADDIIGSLARKYEHIYDVTIVSGDKDFAQLVSEHISLYDIKNNAFITEKEIFEKYELYPSQFVDYLAIVGDSSDNIPGAKGIGPKGAVRILQIYQTVEQLYENIDVPHSDIAKLRDKLLVAKDDVFLSKRLATIRTDLFSQGELCERADLISDTSKIAWTKTLPLLDELELKRLSKEINEKWGRVQLNMDFSADEDVMPPEARVPDTDEVATGTVSFALIHSITHLQEILSRCASSVIAIDTETTSVDTQKAEIVGISFCYNESESYYIPLAHAFAQNLDTTATIDILRSFLSDKIIVGHNIKYDIQILYHYGLNIESITQGKNIFDTMLAAYILDPGGNEYSLSACASREYNYTMLHISELIGRGKKQISFDMVDVDIACRYSADDAYITFRLYQLYSDRLASQGLYQLYHQIELPLIFTLAYMERQGVYIRASELNNLSHELAQQIQLLAQKIYEVAGEIFNINSPQQLSGVLFDKLKLKPIKKTKEGFSTDIEVLESLTQSHPLPQHIIEYRHLIKMKNTYIDALPQLLNPLSKRIHTSFNQTITSTGRLSSTNPNLQNIPIKSELGKKIRKTFTAPQGKYIISADYSQIELRLLAFLSGDKPMNMAFQAGVDIHTSTASIIFHIDKSSVDANLRRKAKAINFGIIYGMGAQSLAKEVGISISEARDFIDGYFREFPTIKAFLDSQKMFASQNGYVESIYSRRLYLPDINSPNARYASEAQRIAVNMPIQGSAADIIKIAMINIYEKIKNRDDIKMLIQVHDELVFEVEQQSLIDAVSLIKDEMEQCVKTVLFPTKYDSTKINLVVDVGYGESWNDAH
jgi:DNA polymerase-1